MIKCICTVNTIFFFITHINKFIIFDTQQTIIQWKLDLYLN